MRATQSEDPAESLRLHLEQQAAADEATQDLARFVAAHADLTELPAAQPTRSTP